MIYPEYIKKGDTIATTAVSAGCENEIDNIRLEIAKKNFEDLGYKVIETPNCRTNSFGRSSSKTERAKQFNNLIKDKSVKAIICLSGGDFLMEMLPYMDMQAILNNPKWLQGYSDPTGILYTVTTKLDIATIYGNTFKTFSMNPMHKSLKDSVKLLEGKNILQKSFSKYEAGWREHVTGYEPYCLNKKVKWTNAYGEEEVSISGRIIGGCLDCILDLLGTKFDGTAEFINKYKKDGIIWYFDVYALSNEDIIRAMWKFEQMDYFKYIKGIVFGRLIEEKSDNNIKFKDTIIQSLSYLNVPIIIDADIGHVSPRVAIINGAIAYINSKNGKGEISFETK